MKKLLSLFIVLSLVLSSLFVLSSCKDEKENSGNGGNDDVIDIPVTEEDVKNQAVEVVSKSYDKTISNFYETSDESSKIIDKALKAGSFSIGLNGKVIDPSFGDIKYTAYKYLSGEGASTRLEGVYNEQKIATQLFVTPDGIAIADEGLFGLNTAVKVTVDKFLEEFKTHEAFVGLTEEQKAMIEKILQQFKSVGKVDEELKSQITKCFEPTVKPVEVEVNGEKVKTFEVALNINNKVIFNLFDLVKGKITDEAMQQQIESLKPQIETFLKDNNIEIAFKSYIDITKQVVVDAKLDFALNFAQNRVDSNNNPTQDKHNITVNIDFDLSDTEIKLLGTVKLDTEAITLNASIVKEVKDGAKVFTTKVELKDAQKSGYEFNSVRKVNDAGLTVDSKLAFVMDETSNNVLEINLNYNKATGAYAVTATINNASPVVYKAEGIYKVSETAVNIALNKIAVAEAEIELGLTIDFDTEGKAPAMPEDARELTSLSMTEINDILAKVQTSPFIQIIQQFSKNTQPVYR